MDNLELPVAFPATNSTKKVITLYGVRGRMLL